MNFNTDIDYKQRYETYRKLPFIIAIIEAAAMFLLIYISAISLLISNVTGPGILLFLLGWIAPVLNFLIVNYFLSLLISPTIVRTDAVLAIKKSISSSNTSNAPVDIAAPVDTSPAGSTSSIARRWQCPKCGKINDANTEICASCLHGRHR